MGYIEGVDRHQSVLFPASLDEYVGADNPVRVIEEFVEGLDLVAMGFGRAVPAVEGRPGYNPRAMLKLYVYGYMNRCRSSRKLEEETHRNIEVMWLMRLQKPDHKTIAEFRRQNPKALKKTTADFVRLCREMRLLDAKLVAIDGSKFRAVNGRDRNYTKAKIESQLRRCEAKVAQYLDEMDRADRQEADLPGVADPELPKKLSALRERMKELREIQQRIDETHDQVSLTDPESRRMKVRGDHDVCYNAQIAVDDKHHLIVALDVTNEPTDIEQLAPMAIAAKDALQVETLDVVADAGYHNGSHVVVCESIGITPYVPGTQTSKNEAAGLFTKEDFRYDEERDAYQCPAGCWLARSTQTLKQDRVLSYYRNGPACRSCSLRTQCTTNRMGRRIMRTPEEAQVEAMRKRVTENRARMAKRKTLVEHPFGTMKRSMDAGYFLMKGREKVSAEFSLTGLAYNLKRVIEVLGVECLLEALRIRRRTQNAGLSPA